MLIDVLFAALSNVSRLEQTVDSYRYKVVWFLLDAPSSQAGARNALWVRRKNRKRNFRPPQGENFWRIPMKKAFLWMAVPALLIALGFAQTPAPSTKTEPTNIKGCLGGSDPNYTLVEDNTGFTFKIATSGVDLKPHLGHDVTLLDTKLVVRASAATDNSFVVTELNMMSDHCAAAASIATASTPSETASTPAAATASAPAAATASAPAGPAASISTPAETAVKPDAPAAPVSTTTDTTVTPAATVSATPETAVSPAAPATAAAATATVSATPETTVTPAAAATPPATHASQRPAHPRTPATPAADATPPATGRTSSEPTSTAAAVDATPAETASTSSETASTPAAVATPPTKPARGGSFWFLIAFALVVIVIGTMAPLLSRWRKRKNLERRGAENLSFTKEASSDTNKSEPSLPRKAA